MSLAFHACALIACLLPQGQLRRAVPAKADVVVDPAHHRADRVVVKLAEGSEVSVRDGRLTAPPGRDLSDLQRVVGSRAVRPFFAGLDRELDALRQRVLAAMPPGEAPPADLRLYAEVDAAGLDDARALVRALNDLPLVELAYPRQLPVPPPGEIPPLTPNLVANQGYRSPAPSGVDARALRQVTGAYGAGITLCDIEWGWRFDHEDIAALRPSALVGPPIFNHSADEHGVAVAGIIAGDPDQYGVSGLTPDVRFVAVTDYPAAGYSVAAAIVVALTVLQPQDVLLLEAQAQTPLGLGPTEWIQADFDAIQNATRLGILTVEAAGNGGVDLDSPQLGGMFNRNVRDSGAILVGASAGSSLQRGGGSSYGSRVDANGWGSGVASTGYGDLFQVPGDPRQFYTAMFNGTSSASPMVAASAVALIGAARAQLDPAAAAAIDYRVVRAALQSFGTPLLVQGIGNRPDLARMLAGIGAERGLRVLDDVRLGRVFRLEVEAPFAATPSDLWLLAGATQPANLALPLANPEPLCRRLLLDPAGVLALAAAPFPAGPAVLGISVPNNAALRQARYYFQALTLQAATNAACLTNSAMAHVEW